MTALRSAVTPRHGQSGIMVVEYLILVGFIALLSVIAVWDYGEHVEAGICNQTSTLDGIDVQASACAAPEEFSPDVDLPEPPGPPDPQQSSDLFGCDPPASFGTESFGSCCDGHDHCFDVNECTSASWLCSPGVCAAIHVRYGFLLGALCDAFASDPEECRPEDVSAACGECNVTAAICIFDGPSGPSACVAAGNCHDSRPPGCVVRPDGQCE